MAYASTEDFFLTKRKSATRRTERHGAQHDPARTSCALTLPVRSPSHTVRTTIERIHTLETISELISKARVPSPLQKTTED